MIEKTDGGGLRYNEGKTQHNLTPVYAQEQYAKVLTRGAIKYGPDNWRRGMRWSTVLASLKRHVLAIESGQDVDEETGLLHSAHIMCNAAFLTEYYKIYPQGDDRGHSYLKTPKIGLDIDEVICDWVGAWVAHHKIPTPKSWFFDRDIVAKFNAMSKAGTLNDFYLALKPKIHPDEIPFEPHCYITSRPVPTEISEKWLDSHGFPARPVYTVGPGESKLEVIKKSGVDIFVDDRFDNFQELNKAGVCTYLFDAPHNQRYNVGYKRIFSLKELV